MSYTKLDPQPANLTLTLMLDGVANVVPATAVQLDSGDIVAVGAYCCISPSSGDATTSALARVINADGTDRLDATGQPMQSQFTHTTTQSEVAAVGSVSGVQRCVLMAVLGESTAPLWDDPICATMLANASIRTNLASAAHAGVVSSSALL